MNSKDKSIKTRVRDLEQDTGKGETIGWVDISVEDWEAGRIPPEA